MGMVGGGQGAFIGDVHRLAARLDGKIDLVCGAFSRDPENCIATGRQLGLHASRCYANYDDMMRAEAALPDDQRMHFVAIVTPNHVHFPVAKAALEAGFHVLSDKPATLNLDEARELAGIVQRNDTLAYG
ncbi:MAG: Gfo/Idh/MocA family oxidoreductase, partial [Alphaproteobacteria bacterium]|nr:Gfo/Idh/MocA family oxidoreductase [Alphaproteobacteria bacterium]